MSRKSVRYAAAQYISSPQLPGVGKVFPSPPKVSRSGDAFENTPPGTPSGSVIYVEVLHADEVRIAVGGPKHGVKKATYKIRFHLLFRSRQDTSESAMDDHDDQLDALLVRLREDRTLGTNGKIVEFGQDAEGIVYDTGMPKTSGTGSTLIWTLVEGNVWEVFDG